MVDLGPGKSERMESLSFNFVKIWRAEQENGLVDLEYNHDSFNVPDDFHPYLQSFVIQKQGEYVHTMSDVSNLAYQVLTISLAVLAAVNCSRRPTLLTIHFMNYCQM